MRIIKIACFVIPFLAASSARADYYVGQGRCNDGDTIVHVRECRAAGVTGRTDGFAVAVCCKSSGDSSKYKDEADEQVNQE